MIEYIKRNGYTFQVDRSRPWLRFLGGGGGGKKVVPHPVPDPVPTPEEIDTQAIDSAQKERRRGQGRQSTILTGLGVSNVSVNENLEPKKSLLG